MKRRKSIVKKLKYQFKETIFDEQNYVEQGVNVVIRFNNNLILARPRFIREPDGALT